MTEMTIVGNTTAPVELKFLPNGKAVANFTVAQTPRYLDKTTNEWKDGQALFLRCSLWGTPAENLAQSELARGTRVVVTGKLKQRNFETQQGEKRTVIELEVDDIGASMKSATVTVTKTSGSGGKSNTAASDEPWGAKQSAAYDDSVPF